MIVVVFSMLEARIEKLTNFSNDVYIRQLGPFRIFYKDAEKSDDTLRVCELVMKSGSWDWFHLSYLVPDHIVTQITTVLPHSPNACQDRLAWKWMRKDDFSTVETYKNMHALYDMVSTAVIRFGKQRHLKGFGFSFGFCGKQIIDKW
ncbi:hypothetical protein PVK06_023602 [Gossypium arboreum]|uniref:Uncharacterized protein n=1 Tax=Gossypium arboreum TaxID=29729 RepID=A0ABR0PBJ5_GOSAR|nr:hypothetical protein PVK06_023602 [Gossypium arboreum]